MENNARIEDILYVEKKSFKYILQVIISIFILSVIFINDHIVIINYIKDIIYLISGFCIIILTYSISSISRNKIFNYIAINFFIISLLSLYAIINNQQIGFDFNADNIKKYLDVIIIYKMLAISLSSLLIYIYIYNGELYLKKYYSLILLTSFFIIIFFMLGYKNQINLLIKLIIPIINYIGISFIKEYKLIIDKRINYIYLYGIINFFISIIFLFTILFKNIFIISTLESIYFFAYSIFFIYTIDKLLNNPYKTLFKDLYESDSKLNDLNINYCKKISEMEFSHALVKKKENTFKEFLKNIPIPLIILNNNNERIIYGNLAFLNLLNKSNLKDIINKKISNIISIDSDTNSSDIKSGEIYRGELGSGKLKRYLSIEVVDNNYENGELIIIVNDVTSKVKLTSIEESMKEKVLQEKIRRDFLSNISHDLKTPINVIYSATQLEEILIDNENKEALIKYNNISKQNCLALTSLANNLIDSGKIHSGYLHPRMKIINIVEFTEEIVSGLIHYAKEKEITLIFDTDKEEIELYLDENFMQRILLNCISNALKFTNKNGNILVRIKEDTNYVTINIIDNGIGIEEKFLENIFERYSMGSNNKSINEKGSGIGLFVVKKLVEVQGGEISIKSKLNQWTSVNIRFRKVDENYI